MTAPVLRGPANPDAFRIKVGRYGDRWYHDPLPGCDIAPATEASWPSVTTIKNAIPKPQLTNWAAECAATYAVDNQPAWENLERDVAIKVIKGEPDRVRDRAGDRGSAIHSGLEAIAAGKPLDELVDHEIADWIGAMRALVTEVNPTWVLTEAVAISRTLQMGGTLDAVWTIDGKHYVIDFKSRAAGKVDTAYEDEGLQIAAYAGCDYVIVDDGNGRAVRRRLPELAGGLIVSIAPEGYRLYPVDLKAGARGVRVLRDFWQVQADRGVVGKPVLLGNSATPLEHPSTAGEQAASPTASLERRAWLIGCVEAIRDAGHLDDLAAIWPDGVPTFKTGGHTDAQLDAITAAVDQIGKRHALPFFQADPTTIPDEPAVAVEEPAAAGERVEGVKPSDPRVIDLIDRLKALPADLADLVTRTHPDVPHLASGRITEEQLVDVGVTTDSAISVHISRIEQLHAWRAEFDDDTLFVSLVRLASGQDDPRPLTAFTEAHTTRLRSLIAGIDSGVVAVAISNDGEVTVSVTADATTVLIERHGARKQVIEAAKAFAPSLGLKAPRSVADVVADPLLTALTAA